MEKKAKEVETYHGNVTGVSFEQFSRGMKVVVVMDGRIRVVHTAWDNKDGKDPMTEAVARVEELNIKKGVNGTVYYTEREGAMNQASGKPYMNRDMIDFKADDTQSMLAAQAPTPQPTPTQQPTTPAPQAPLPSRNQIVDDIKQRIFEREKECMLRCLEIFHEAFGHKPETDGDKNIIQTMLGSTFIEINKRC